MSRTENHTILTLIHNKTGEAVKPGDIVYHTADRRGAVVGSWNTADGRVDIWTVPSLAGRREHLTPWPATALDLAWVSK